MLAVSVKDFEAMLIAECGGCAWKLSVHRFGKVYF